MSQNDVILHFKAFEQDDANCNHWNNVVTTLHYGLPAG